VVTLFTVGGKHLFPKTCYKKFALPSGRDMRALDMNRTRLTMGLMLTTALAAPALAQDDQPYQLDEIVIYYGALGTKPIDAKSYGRSVTVLTADQIQQRGYTDVRQALSAIPGVAIAATDATLGSVFLRGGESNMTVVLIDGVKASVGYNGAYYMPGLNLSDIARIEVLRGPQSVIGGANAASGVIAITTKSAETEGLFQQAGIGYGSYGSTHLSYDLQVKGARGQLAIGVSRDHDGGFDVSGDHGVRDQSTISTLSVKGQYQLADWVTIGMMARRSYQSYDFDALSDSATTADAYVIDADMTGKRGESFGQLWAKFDSLGGRLEHKLSYSGVDYRFATYNSGVSLGANSSQHRALDYTATYALDAGTVAEARQTISFAAQEETDHFRRPGSSFDYARTTRSLAAQYSGSFDSGLGIEAGVRRILNDDFADATTWNLAASWEIPSTALRLHSSIGKAVVNPDMYEQYGYSPGSFTGNPDLKPETVHGIDLGAEWRFSEAGSLDVTLFQQRISDRIITAYVPPTYAATVLNAPGTATARGVELSATYQVSPQLSLAGSYTYTHARGADGERLARRPTQVAALSATYQMLEGRASATLGVQHVAGNYDTEWFNAAADYPTTKLPDYTLVNLSGRYGLSDRADLVARIDNVTDVDHSAAWGYASAGRTGYLGLEAKW
jgi:Outer membrane cobalamin receptor protein